jgi:aconitate hydratase
VMLRAAFHNKTLINALHPQLPVAHTLHAPSGQVLPIWEAAQRYRDAGQAVIVVAGERYGMGSSRDWAAKGQRLLGIRAVIASSFERIHRSNLIGMGIVPLCFAPSVHVSKLGLVAGDCFELDLEPHRIAPRGMIHATLRRANGIAEPLALQLAVETQLEVKLLTLGGVIPSILAEHIQTTALA